MNDVNPWWSFEGKTESLAANWPAAAKTVLRDMARRESRLFDFPGRRDRKERIDMSRITYNLIFRNDPWSMQKRSELREALATLTKEKNSDRVKYFEFTNSPQPTRKPSSSIRRPNV